MEDPKAGDLPVDQTKTDDAGSTPPADVVARADHDRALKDLQKFKAEAKTLREQQAKAQDDKMKENQQYKELLEKKEIEVESLKKQSDDLKSSFVNREKYNAVHQVAAKLGLIDVKDLDGLDLDGVVLETTSTGKVNVLGADKYVERLKTLKPHWFGNKTPPNVNLDNPKLTPGTNTVVNEAEILKLQKEARKSGDSTAYHAALKKYKAARGKTAAV